MHQSPSTFGQPQPGSGTKKQKPSPPPRYHDLVDNTEMGIIISPRDSREVEPKMTSTPSMKLHIKNFEDHSSDICQKKRIDMRIPGICGR